jgi:outer membrane receptor protein involved in Fe transport
MILLLIALIAAQPSSSTITGTVRDPAGSVVPGATILVKLHNGAQKQTSSGPDGRFSMNAPDLAEIVVRAAGFAEWRSTFTAVPSSPLEVVLAPAAVTETVTVTPSRGEQRSGDVPASVTVLGRAAIEESAGITADEVLRQVPSFSLFRRSSSLVSHPTTQGVSLRGVGPSGVSRTLVLLDDVPFNDPFGGWVYWSRVPLESTDRIEVVESPSSSLYGTYAMGGVINIATRRASPALFDLRTQYGSHTTPRLDVEGAAVRGRIGVIATASALRTNGFPIIAPAERGPVDINASLRYRNLNAMVQYDPTPRLHMFARVGSFEERRVNGKISTIDRTPEKNDTSWTSASGGIRAHFTQAEWRATVFGDDETFHSNYLSANATRTVGRMTLNQTVPVKAAGASTQWSQLFGARHYVTAGADLRWVKGDSEEQPLDTATGTQPTLNRISGGRQRSVGAFVQDQVAFKSVTLIGSARVDRWRNYDAHNLETLVSTGLPGPGNAPSLADREDTVVSPRLGAMYRVASRVRAWGSIGTGFRAPTLNELYRQFRVGNVLTLANNALGPEHLRGYETGISVDAARDLVLRATWFDNRLRDPISNATISTAPTVIQQRQNLGRTHVRGIQSDAEYRAGAQWIFTASYIYDRATVSDNPANPQIVGNTLPQVPRHRASLRAAFTAPRIATISAAVSFNGAQFDDDRNTASRRLPQYTVVDLTAARTIVRGIELFAAAQNLLDRTYIVGTLPTTIGSPRFVSAGVRVRFAR